MFTLSPRRIKVGTSHDTDSPAAGTRLAGANTGLQKQSQTEGRIELFNAMEYTVTTKQGEGKHRDNRMPSAGGVRPDWRKLTWTARAVSAPTVEKAGARPESSRLVYVTLV